MARVPGPFLLVLVAAACGGGDGGDAGPPDGAAAADAAPLTCDVLGLEDCTTDSARPKCAITLVANRLTTRCMEQTGSLGAGETCTRGATNGIDDCARHHFCSGLGAEIDDTGTPLARACRAYCVEDVTCAVDQRCITLVVDPRVGLCVPAGCRLFDESCPRNTACDAFVHHDGQTFVGVCRPIGPVPVGGDCAAADCVAGARCFGSSSGAFQCRALCDDMHPCASGLACSPLAGLPNGAGVCP
jgi:hypothetical protein